MRTIKLTIEYDGTQYAGWQIQPNGLAVQEVLEKALSGLLEEKVRVFSSGRTDAGVHARGMVAAFQTERTIPVKAFREGLNSLLPPDIAIREAVEVPPGFNPRRDAVAKIYRYTIYNSPRRSPLNRYYVWRVGETLDLAVMQRAAALFVGEKDFAAFRASNCAAKTTVRRIYSLDIFRRDDMIVFDVRGSGFLKNMVRIMVGTLVEVGRGSMDMHEIESLFQELDRRKAGITAPPQGLCLVEVFY
ncbi:MAG: tRNA pseudouridine(38-40) synthase TruA [Deltaproteobacteria bacterium]|nr:tRNA pseudouridine(38-40) synthase TruA [Deltaproteobacteria bacterium]TLN02505.1 MAG: tRNA pseudouridine(38-40) synthase TruA [bacterium]